MDIQRLSAKQKRIQDWNKALVQNNPPVHLRVDFENQLKGYRNFLAKLWETGTIEPEDVVQIENFERILEQLHEEVRFVGRTEGERFS